MSIVIKEIVSEKSKLLLSIQRALLGVIGTEILAISVKTQEQVVELVAYTEGNVSDEQRDALEWLRVKFGPT